MLTVGWSGIITTHSWQSFLKIKFYLVSAIWSRRIDPFDPANQLRSLYLHGTMIIDKITPNQQSAQNAPI